MAKRKTRVDTVRASRDGHEYHEAWTARKAMQLLWPDSDLAGIAVEGLSSIEEESASSETIEIADVTLYYGRGLTFRDATRTIISQLKYSISDKDEEFRASNAKKTVGKFAKSYLDYLKHYGKQAVHNKLHFHLITNRPIYNALHSALDALAEGSRQNGEVEKQAQQFKKASGLKGAELAAFAARVKFIGLSGNLKKYKHELAGLIVDWSATNDYMAAARLGQLRQMVRDKAGSVGHSDKIIRRTDILYALDVKFPEELLPTPAAIRQVEKVVTREQLTEVTTLISGLKKPLLIHASGGIGKTVFMNCLAKAVGEKNEVVFFDCFAGGAYRSPHDARHLHHRGLIHIANTLAFRSLCDPILSGKNDITSLLITFRKRLSQCVRALDSAASERQLVLFIDALDNAELIARERGEHSFATDLLESFNHEPVPSVKLIVSCRSYRKPKNHAECQEFELHPFTINETGAFLKARDAHISPAKVKIAQARSGGNPRVLEYLLSSENGLIERLGATDKVELDDLIQKKISDALADMLKLGYSSDEVSAFLAGLAVLPPPIPVDEYAGALGMSKSAIESFAADLHPLLERTNEGLMFRDEPTESFIRDRYSSSKIVLRRVADNLLERQDKSVYAARALPELLHHLDDTERLFNLAFDSRIPQQITGTVGKQNVRHARIRAAVLHAAFKKDYNHLVELLVELSTIAASDLRGGKYILSYPELVVAAGDVDAKRRLFEARTGWPGTRHARLTIANILTGDSDEASRHAAATREWFHHYRTTFNNQDRQRPSPDEVDVAAIILYYVSENQPASAASFLQSVKSEHAFEITRLVFNYLQLSRSLERISSRQVSAFSRRLNDVGALASALSFYKWSSPTVKLLVLALAEKCRAQKTIETSPRYFDSTGWHLLDGMYKTSAIALSLGLPEEAASIALAIPSSRPRLWGYRSYQFDEDMSRYVVSVALEAAAKGIGVHEIDLVPSDLAPMCSGISRDIEGQAFRKELRERMSSHAKEGKVESRGENDGPVLRPDQQHDADEFISYKLQPMKTLANTLSQFFAASKTTINPAFDKLLKAWSESQIEKHPYRTDKQNVWFFRVGFKAILFALWARNQVKPVFVDRFVTMVREQGIVSHDIIQVVSILSERKGLERFAGQQAIEAQKQIGIENNVDSKATLLADLARAIVPCDIDQASVYFRNGLEQLDGIGSEDYDFVSDLLWFASIIRGEELNLRDSHTLTNICEMNMSEDPEKWFWGAFAKAMSNCLGPRVLAKISRWDDRSNVELSYSLLPCLIDLVSQGKLDVEIALALNICANPIEYHYIGTKQFAEAIERVGGGANRGAINELIAQYQVNNPCIQTSDTLESLERLVKNMQEKDLDSETYVSTAKNVFAEVTSQLNDHSNYRPDEVVRSSSKFKEQQDVSRRSLEAIAKATNPTILASLEDAVGAISTMEDLWSEKWETFDSIRSRVPFAARRHYLRDITSIEHFQLYPKLDELKRCKEAWCKSSIAIEEAFKELAKLLIMTHCEDLIRDGALSGSIVKEISELTGVPGNEIALTCIPMYLQSGISVSGSVWLSLASYVCPEADPGKGQKALSRLLGSNAATMSNSVVDGEWTDDLYPENGNDEIAAGFIWRLLGSPKSENRWRATHSLRCLARFGRWSVVDRIVNKIDQRTAGAFQAKEHKFFYLHARLWLCIALARIAKDHPSRIARYGEKLLTVISGEDSQHVLIREWASRTVLICCEGGHYDLSADLKRRLKRINRSPHKRLKKKIRTNGGFYSGRSNSERAIENSVDLDYEFRKVHIDSLSMIFGMPIWKLEDRMSSIIRLMDSEVSSMHESDGRTLSGRYDRYTMTDKQHTYGQYLGWHALFFAAGAFLEELPVTNDWWYENDPWGEWLSRYLLSRSDGLWLSDGTDWIPVDTVQLLLEKGESGLVLTGDREKLLGLAGLNSGSGEKIVVKGSWHSADNIHVRIASTLVDTKRARKVAESLIQEEPMHVWLPSYEEEEDGSEYLIQEKEGCSPWIVCPWKEARFDEYDPLGTPYANNRPRVCASVASFLKVFPDDAFRRLWRGEQGISEVWAEAWNWKARYADGQSHPGLRLSCGISALKRILNERNADLLVLINLEQHESGGYRGRGGFTNTVAVARILKSGRVEYYPGAVNHLHVSEY